MNAFSFRNFKRTTIRIAIAEMFPDQVLHPKCFAEAQPRSLIARPVPRAIILTNRGLDVRDRNFQQSRVPLQLLLQDLDDLRAGQNGLVVVLSHVED